MSPKLYTTREAAAAVGISRVTLQRWIANGKLKAPKPQLRNGVGLRLWTQSDVARLRAEKQRIYGKGRGRKKKKV